MEIIGHDAIRVTNIIVKKRVNGVLTKIALPLFFVNLVPKPNNKDAYKLNQMFHCKIKIESPRKKNEIPQCKRCQSFGHTQNYCHKQAKCVKCGENHHTTECKILKKAACKCANCGGDHTANWKGCPAYKAKVASIKTSQTATQRIKQRTWEPSEKVTLDKAYAKAVSNKPKQSSNNQTDTD